MKIDRTNYEIWFIDWLDGNLTDSQVRELDQFLKENQDLKEEFNELRPFTIKPSDKRFPKKELLKKTPGDISQTQFEYLCAAYLENDLSDSQVKEIEEILALNPDRKKTFDLVQKMRLTPPVIEFKHKNLLRRRTASQKIIRLSLIGLSAAAVITIIILTYIFVPRNPTAPLNNVARNGNAENRALPPSSPTGPDKVAVTNSSSYPSRSKPNHHQVFRRENSAANMPSLASLPPQDSLKIRRRDTETVPSRVIIKTTVYPGDASLSNTLIALNSESSVPATDKGRSNVGRFIAKTFREKILREKAVSDSPLKAYEIAEAGVTGLNKLLGWEMALDKRNDENGQLKSVYFSSRILKFNAPVKKIPQLP